MLRIAENKPNTSYMFIRIIILLLLFVTFQEKLYSQVDSVSTEKPANPHIVRSLILPTSFCIAGVIIKGSSFRKSFQEDVQASRWRTNTHVDNYIQYAPMAEMYVADIFYSKTKNEVFQQSKNLIISQLFTAVIVQALKMTTNVTRPNGAAHSFPSGHSSVAFTGATALYLEYRDSNPFLAYSGYGFSTATGILRVTNNRHWVSDVLVGAGIGMFSAQLTWYINPFKNWKPFKSSKVAIYPYVDGLDSSAGLCMVF